MAKILVSYLTYSGNTKEVAEIVSSTLSASGHSVDLHRIGTAEIPEVREYDALILGSFTWGKGRVPKEMKQFVAEVGYKPDTVYVFGTGDTQFGGDELFCYAVDRLLKFYESLKPGLKVEQSPRGDQEEKVWEWAKGVAEELW